MPSPKGIKRETGISDTKMPKWKLFGGEYPICALISEDWIHLSIQWDQPANKLDGQGKAESVKTPNHCRPQDLLCEQQPGSPRPWVFSALALGLHNCKWCCALWVPLLHIHHLGHQAGAFETTGREGRDLEIFPLVDWSHLLFYNKIIGNILTVSKSAHIRKQWWLI